MHRHHAFTLTEMCTAIAIGVLLFTCSHTMLGCGDGGSGKPTDSAADAPKPGMRDKARQLQNIQHITSIQQGLILFAQGNYDYYPGVNRSGERATADISAKPGAFGFATPDGSLVAYRVALLLRGSYFTPAQALSPFESNKAITPAKLGENFADGTAYSYAMLDISNTKHPRFGEWRATNNSRAIVISDRNIGSGATGPAAQSIHTSPGGGWQGVVCHNDLHANYETSDVVRTEYSQRGEVAADQLFSNAEKTDSGAENADAAMVFKADNTYVNQQP